MPQKSEKFDSAKPKRLVFSLKQLILLRANPRLMDIMVDILQSQDVTTEMAIFIARDRLGQLDIPFSLIEEPK